MNIRTDSRKRLVALSAVFLTAAVLFWQVSPDPEQQAPENADLPEPEAPPIAASPGESSVGAKTQAQTAEPNTEVMRGCSWETVYLPRDDGTTISARQCIKTEAAETDPYFSYDNATLTELAYSDAKAAETLGMRLRETDEKAAISLIVRASALGGGDPAPLLRFSNAYPHPSYVDDEPVRKTIHTKYVLSAVAEMLGESATGLASFERQVRETSTSPEETLAKLDGYADAILGEIQSIQSEVGIAPTSRGDDDA